MELAIASAIGVLVACGIYLVLRARSFETILGLTLLSYAVNVFIFSMGRPVTGRPPVIDRADPAPSLAAYTDPLPQALVLTAIVIAFAMTAVLLAVAVRSRRDNHSDHVDGAEPEENRIAFPPSEQEREAATRREKRS